MRASLAAGLWQWEALHTRCVPVYLPQAALTLMPLQAQRCAAVRGMRSTENDVFAETNLLPGGAGVPNTPWRRLLADLQDAGSLPELQRLHALNAHKPAWRPVHDAALLMLAAALAYPRAVAQSQGGGAGVDQVSSSGISSSQTVRDCPPN